MSQAQTSSAVTALSALARERCLRVAVVESLTSGGLAHAVGAGDEASEWFAGGIVAYMQDVKEHVLGVSVGVDPCSAECTEQLAAGGRELFAADVCVATTGVGGPEPEGGHAAGTVYIGWAVEGAHGHRLLQLDGAPEQVMEASIAAAIELLLERGAEVPERGDAQTPQAPGLH